MEKIQRGKRYKGVYMKSNDVKSTLSRIELKYPYFFGKNGVNEELVSAYILEKPQDVADEDDLKEFLGENYLPGTFILSERETKPGFLFDEKIKDFDEWIFNKIESEIKMLIRCESLEKLIREYDKDTLIIDASNIVKFRFNNEKRLCDCITNQEYSDIFRKIIIFLLRGNNYETFPLFKDFNAIGRKLSLQILEETRHYTLYERLKQSISSGLIGLDFKDDITRTSQLGEEGIIPIKLYDTNEARIKAAKILLENKVSRTMEIDAWKEYKEEVLENEKPIFLTWITDDFIPTIFEMKFIEEQLDYKQNLKVLLVPRKGYYGNDADYSDVISLLTEPLFRKLHNYHGQGRFLVSEHGMDLGAFNGLRITKQLLEQIKKSDVLVITGARSFEMAQGLNKNIYFSGIAVCRKYTESVTGIYMESGASVFLKQVKKLPAFYNFKAREWRRFTYNDVDYPVAEYMAREYIEAIRSDKYQKILSKFSHDEALVSERISEAVKKYNLNIVEIINKEIIL